ncbi:MAG: DUF4271 domain-containing protein, partial [Polaribacter sp.]
MHAVEKIVLSTSWITIILVMLFALIVVLRIMDAAKLKRYAFALFKKEFVETEIEEETSFFSLFNSILFMFCVTVLALVVQFYLADKTAAFTTNLPDFLCVFTVVFSYFIVKWLLEMGVAHLFLIKQPTHLFLIFKFSYLCAISFMLFISFIIFKYSQLEMY